MEILPFGLWPSPPLARRVGQLHAPPRCGLGCRWPHSRLAGRPGAAGRTRLPGAGHCPARPQRRTLGPRPSRLRRRRLCRRPRARVLRRALRSPLPPAASRRPSPADNAPIRPCRVSCPCTNGASARVRPQLREARRVGHRRCRRGLLAANPRGGGRLLHAASLAPQGRPLGLDRVGSSANALGWHPPSARPACPQPPRTAQPAHNRSTRRRCGHCNCPALFFARWPLSGLCLGRARLQQPLVPRPR